MSENDLFTLVRPSGQSQGPRLKDAIKSLKLVNAATGAAIAGVTVMAGLIEKMNKPHALISRRSITTERRSTRPSALLIRKIRRARNNSISYCESMISRGCGR